MPNENWRSTVGFEHDATGPDRLVAWSPRLMNSSGLDLKRNVVASLRRRDPHRAASEQLNLLSTFAAEWDFPLTSAVEYLQLVLEALGDVGRTNAAEGSTVYKVGRGKDPVRTNLYMDGVDGTHHKAAGCILTDLTLNVDTLKSVTVGATWAARELVTGGGAFAGDAAPASGRLAMGRDSLVTVGETQYPVFGWSVGFQREAQPAGLNENGVASAWGGNLTFDIGGKLVCRCTRPDFDEALTSQRIDPITAVIQFAGGSSLTMAFHRCILQADAKRVVSPEQYEYSLSWAATQADDDDCAIITLAV